jgi:phosphosulfolactate synthase
MTQLPDFLSVPPRAVKPRHTGVTHVLDKAAPIPLLDAYLGQVSDSVDLVKIGWGLAYLDPRLTERVALCRRLGVRLVTGGTLLEIAAQQQRVSQFRDWALACGIETVEVSNGLGLLRRDDKHQIVEQLSRDFVVLAETGSKDGSVVADPREWVSEMADDLAAGASWVIAEGRESGTVGLYQSDGSVREELVDAVTSCLEFGSVIFEAPRKAQQLWLIQRLGPDVGLGNVELTEVASVESLRVGLRADTALHFLGAGRA